MPVRLLVTNKYHHNQRNPAWSPWQKTQGSTSVTWNSYLCDNHICMALKMMIKECRLCVTDFTSRLHNSMRKFSAFATQCKIIHISSFSGNNVSGQNRPLKIALSKVSSESSLYEGHSKKFCSTFFLSKKL